MRNFPKFAGRCRARVVADVVISLQASRPELISRLLARTEAEERADDVHEVIEHRLRVFDAGIGPMLDFYRAGHPAEIDSRPVTAGTAKRDRRRPPRPARVRRLPGRSRACIRRGACLRSWPGRWPCI